MPHPSTRRRTPALTRFGYVQRCGMLERSRCGLLIAPFFSICASEAWPMSTFPLPHNDSDALSIARSHRPMLERVVLLSLLLHVLAVLLFGDAGGDSEAGGQRRGAQLWGAFRATLSGDARDVGPARKFDRVVESGALARRSPDNNLLSATPVAPAAPATPAMPTQQNALPAPPQPGEAESAELLPYIAKEVIRPQTDFVVAPPTRIPEVVAPAAEQSHLVPLLPLPAAEPVVAPTRALAPAPPPAREPAVIIPPLVPLPTATIEREPPAQLLPRVSPIVPPPPLTPLLAAKIEREYAPIAEPLPPVLPVAAAPNATPPSMAPARVERSYAPIAEPLAPILPLAPMMPAPAAARELMPYVAPVFVPSVGSDAKVTPDVPAARTTPQVPSENAGSRPEPAAVSASSTVGPPAPSLDLDAIRDRARGIAGNIATDGRREGAGPRTVFPFPTVPPESLKSKEAKIFDKALQRPDCRDAYAGLGLAAVVPLVADAITNKGCKW